MTFQSTDCFESNQGVVLVSPNFDGQQALHMIIEHQDHVAINIQTVPQNRAEAINQQITKKPVDIRGGEDFELLACELALLCFVLFVTIILFPIAIPFWIIVFAIYFCTRE